MNQLSGSLVLSAGIQPKGGIGGMLDADGDVEVDLRSDGKGVPSVIGIVLVFGGGGILNITVGMEPHPQDTLVDVVGTSFSSHGTSGTFWVSTDNIRYIRLSFGAGESGSLVYYILD